MTEPEDWPDQSGGPLVRQFALVRGRTEPSRRDLDIISLVITARSAPTLGALSGECERIVQLCRDHPLSVAEIASHLDLLLVVAKVLVGDLLDGGHLVLCGASVTSTAPDMRLMQAVLDGIRRL